MIRVGDRVKVVRVDKYLSDLLANDAMRGHIVVQSPLGRVGIVTEVRYNPAMKRTEAVVLSEGSSWIFEPWCLMKTALQ